MKRNTKAFTLIELLVVMVIIGILAAVGVAQFKNYSHKARIAKALAFEREVHQKLMFELTGDQKKPVLILDFDEGSGTTAGDISGNGYNYTVDSDMWVTDTPDGSGAALDAYRSSGNFLQESFNEGASDTMTMSVWVKPVKVNDERGIQAMLVLSPSLSVLKIYKSKIQWYLKWTSVKVETDITPTINQWNHLLATYDGSVAKVYLNGEIVINEAKSLGGDIFPGATIALGDSRAYDDGGQEYYIDRLRLYPNAYIPE